MMRDRKLILDMADTPQGRTVLTYIGAEWPAGNESPEELDAMWERNLARLRSWRQDLRTAAHLRAIDRLH